MFSRNVVDEDKRPNAKPVVKKSPISPEAVWIGQFQQCPAPFPRLNPGNQGFFENKPANSPWLGQTKALPGLPASLVGMLGCPVVHGLGVTVGFLR